MKIPKNIPLTRQRWLKKPFSAYLYHNWLLDNGSLTARLQQRYMRFSVSSVTLKYARPLQTEATLLRQPGHQKALIREVLLLGSGQPVVFAHSVLPRKSLRGAWRSLACLGSQPLGAPLFANPRVRRTSLSYKKLAPNSVLYQRAAQHLNLKPKALWARRSIFSLNCANIMVTEVFLPKVIDSKSH